jgi:2-amino-4-hydroxy-6-hydroxymethyldihydropteridine diphosphokinase
VSSIYETEPVGVTHQPPFLNLALAADTEAMPRDLLKTLKHIEQELGRRTTFRWGPRIVDIDILLFGDRVLQDDDLIVPHRELPNRAFVLVPLSEIAGNVSHPVLHRSIAELRDAAPRLETVRLRMPASALGDSGE